MLRTWSFGPGCKVRILIVQIFKSSSEGAKTGEDSEKTMITALK
jgi:hypothetical protein